MELGGNTDLYRTVLLVCVPCVLVAGLPATPSLVSFAHVASAGVVKATWIDLGQFCWKSIILER